MKPILTILLLLCAYLYSAAQADSTPKQVKNAEVAADSQKINRLKDSVILKNDSDANQAIYVDSISKDDFEKSLESNFPARDSLTTSSVHTDSIKPVSASPTKILLKWGEDTSFSSLLKISFLKIYPVNELKAGKQKTVHNDSDTLFYALAAIVLFMAFIKQAFPKYFQRMFHLLFQPSLRQKQPGEQLMQDALPSLLMNLFFILTAGLFIALSAVEYKWVSIPFWWFVLDCTVILAGVYLVKYLVTSFAGWVFNIREAASSYTFIVFLINKIMALILLPLLILLSFSNENIRKVVMTAGGCITAFLFLYRYAVSLTIIRRQLKVSALHFFIYLCAVEIMPVLVIYKALFSQTGKLFNF